MLGEWDVATQRARAILFARLNGTQRMQWRAGQGFTTIVHGRGYRIGRTGMWVDISEHEGENLRLFRVTEIDRYRVFLGIHPDRRGLACPPEDEALALLLLLRHAPHTVWRTACLNGALPGEVKPIKVCVDSACPYC